MPAAHRYELASRRPPCRPDRGPDALDDDVEAPYSPVSDDVDDPEDRPLIHPSASLPASRKSFSRRAPHPRWARWLLPPSVASRRPLRRSNARYVCQLIVRLIVAVLGFCVLALVLTAIFAPSYTTRQYPESWDPLQQSVAAGGGYNPPGYWKKLPGEDGVQKSTRDGRGNLKGERVFLAANIIDPELIAGEWGERVMELMDMLGQENVFLSIFENDSGVETKEALATLSHRVSAHLPRAGQSIVSTTLPLSGVPRIRLPNNDTHVKRITYLSEVRNRALLPLVGSIPSLSFWNQSSYPAGIEPPRAALSPAETFEPIPEADRAHAPAMPPQYVEHPEAVSRIVFLNDVIFDPVEVLHLIFSTAGGDYAAACGLDYINPFKFYDTFATRDADGYPTGVPFFPYFTDGASRAAVVAGAAEVPVKSCWGGVASFAAQPFLQAVDPVRFRAVPEPYYDASECCLIHGDLNQPDRTFVNPFVRVAYDARTFRWLPAVKLVERIFEFPHRVLIAALGMPWPGPRIAEHAGQVVREPQWDGQQWVEGSRIAETGGFCGNHKLLVIFDKEGGGRGWKGLPIPRWSGPAADSAA